MIFQAIYIKKLLSLTIQYLRLLSFLTYCYVCDIERMDVRMERMERRTLRQLQYSTCVVCKRS